MDLPIDDLYTTDIYLPLSANMGNTIRIMIEEVEDDVKTIDESRITKIWTEPVA